MARKTVEAIMATTHQIDAYGGWKLDVEALEAMRASVTSGRAVWRANHDSRLPMDVRVVSAEVRPRDDDEFELFVVLDVDADDWERGGEMRGFSFTVTATFVAPEPDSELPIVRLFADAACYEDNLIDDVAAGLREAFNPEAGRLYQFSFTPPPTVALDIPWPVVAQIATGTVGSLLAAGLIRLLRGRKRGSVSIFNIKVSRGDQTVTAHVETDDEETIRRAIDKLPDVDLSARYQEFDSETQDWRGPGYL